MDSNAKENAGDFTSGLGAPARRALVNAGFKSLEQLTQVTEAEIAILHGIGPNALNKLRTTLNERGWSFKASGTE